MESRLRKLELAGFSSALIGNVCPKQGFRKVTSTVSASSPRGAGLAARFSPAHLRLRSAGGFAEIPRAGNSVQENKRWAGKPAPSSLLVPFPGSRSASAVPWQRTRATRLLCPCPAASSCPAPRPQSQKRGRNGHRRADPHEAHSTISHPTDFKAPTRGPATKPPHLSAARGWQGLELAVLAAPHPSSQTGPRHPESLPQAAGFYCAACHPAASPRLLPYPARR